MSEHGNNKGNEFQLHVGRIRVSQKVLLDWLQFEGGKIRQVSIHEAFGDIKFVIEHPDLPQYHVGDFLEDVNVLYSKTIGDNGEPPLIERTHPPRCLFHVGSKVKK